MKIPPVVVDTNVVASGLITRDAAAPTARILEAMLRGRLRFFLSLDLLVEYRNVLLRPRLRERHGLSEAAVDVILAEIALHGVFREPAAAAAPPPDPGDAHLWALLAACPGAVLVTGDDTLRRSPPQAASVLSPQEFAAWLVDA